MVSPAPLACKSIQDNASLKVFRHEDNIDILKMHKFGHNFLCRCVSECADVAECEEPSTGAFENHQGPVHGLQIHEGLLYTCSGDNTARAYSLIVSGNQSAAYSICFSSSFSF